MDHFKIETILPSSTLEVRQQHLPSLPSANINIQSMQLLTYDLEVLLESVSEFLNGDDNFQLIVRTLKVLGSSLNDKKLGANL